MAPEALIEPRPREFASEATTCDHCGNPLPERPFVGTRRNDSDARDRLYCCAGCQGVAETIREFGLETYYELRERSDRAQPRPTRRDYREFDDPAFLERYVQRDAEGVSHVELLLEDAHCFACVFILERLPRLVPCVLRATLDLPRRCLRIDYVAERGTLSDVARALDRLGYPPHPRRRDAERDVTRSEERTYLFRLGIAFVCFANAMLFAFALYGEAFQGMAKSWSTTFRLLGAAFAILALVFPGRVFLRGALASVRTGVPHMDLPVAIALTVGTTWGTLNAFTGRGEVYFESLTAVIFLLSLGRYLQFRQQRAAADAVDLLYSLTPRGARKLENGVERSVPAESIAVGDRVAILPGEAVPADGTIVAGASEFDVALLTGESVPRAFAVGDSIAAGVTNLATRVEVEVTAVGDDTQIGRLFARMRREAVSKTPIVRAADRAAHRLVKVALALALLTFALHARESLTIAAEHAIALLIVTCPCALGLATPLAVEAALGRAAASGILVRGGDVLERMGRGIFLFDKTGTLTLGRPRLVEVMGDRSMLRHVAALEREQPHPYARALLDYVAANERHVEFEASDCRAIVGGGVRGVVDGMDWIVGSERLISESGIEIEGAPRRWREEIVERGASPVFVARDGVVVAVLGFGDPVRDDAAATIEGLRARGFELGLVSGDDESIVRAVGRRLGLAAEACVGAATPDRKVEVVHAATRRYGRAFMVGDGVNDAAALAAADVGIAIRGGAEASMQAADVYLARGRLTDILALATGSDRTVRVIRRNLIVSLGYNLIAAALAATGRIEPWMAAILMPLSSLTVVALSIRSKTFEENECSSST